VFRKKKKEPLFDSGPEAFNLLMKDAVLKEFLDEQENNVHEFSTVLMCLETVATNAPGKASTKAGGAEICYWEDQEMGDRHKGASNIGRNLHYLLQSTIQVSATFVLF
jgi:hypothetical protein